MSKTAKPLFRVVKRDNVHWKLIATTYLIAVAVSIALGAILLAVQQVNPLEYYKDMLTIGMIDNRFAYKQLEGLIKLFVPLLITAVALSLAFRMRFWNIGGEGQFIMGALAASAVALTVGDGMPAPVLILLMSMASMIAGGLYGASVAVLKVRYGTNETLLTLMLNYIALYFLKFWGETMGEWNIFLSTESARPLFQTFSPAAIMPSIPTGIGKFSLNISLVIALLICIAVHFYLKRSKQGYEISVVGDSPNTARYAGMKVPRIVVRTIFLSAALIGLAGGFYVSTAGALSISITNGVGWTGIIVAWLAKLNTVGIIVSALLITVLQHGSSVASASYATVDANFANLLQGIILFSVLTADFFIRFQLVGKSKQEVIK